MKLFYSDASPYARQCRIALSLCGLLSETDLILTNPLEEAALRDVNPLGKVPALIDGDKALFDSPLICEYINTIGQRAKTSSCDLFCKAKASYFEMRIEHAAANGILDAAVATVMEKRRTTEHSAYWLERWRNTIATTISTRKLDRLGNLSNPTIATISMACALTYLDFRLPQLPWREWNSALAEWHNEIETAPWMKNSYPC